NAQNFLRPCCGRRCAEILCAFETFEERLGSSGFGCEELERGFESVRIILDVGCNVVETVLCHKLCSADEVFVKAILGGHCRSGSTVLPGGVTKVQREPRPEDADSLAGWHGFKKAQRKCANIFVLIRGPGCREVSTSD